MSSTLFNHQEGGSGCPAAGDYFESEVGISVDAGAGSFELRGGPRAGPGGMEAHGEVGASIPGFGAGVELNPLGQATSALSANINFGKSVGADFGQVEVFRLWLEDTGRCCE